MTFKVTSDGFFLDLWAINSKGEKVYPHIKGKRNITEKGFDITLTTHKEDYHLVQLDKLIDLIAQGHFDNTGRIRMKPKKGGYSNGFAVRYSTMSKALHEEIERRCKK
ncbi:MAG: hypothetical protein GQ569_14770 [Methylococcaceae bacterium]|nr:hypothetical protein [Methylococcaceae bacterium]